MKIVCSGRARFTCVFILLAVLSGLSLQLLALPRSSSPDGTNQVDLQIVVLEGEDGVNVIKNKTAVKPVVEVCDKNKAPGIAVLAGVVVLFVLPESGPTGVFANGARWTSVTTDANGRAVAGAIRPVGQGPFKIEIRATYQGQYVTRTISQTNFSTVAQALKAGKTPGSSTHDELANQNAGEGAGQSGRQINDGATSAPAATTVAAGAAQDTTPPPPSPEPQPSSVPSTTDHNKTAPKGGGHVGAWVLGSVLAGGAVAGAVEAASLLKPQKNCGSAPNICSVFDPNYQACLANFQQQIANYCSCNGFPSGHDLGAGATCP